MDTLTRPILAFTRHIKAPPARIFRAWTEGEALMRWFGPGGNVRVVSATVELRVGGGYSIRLEKANGEKHHVRGVYREIVTDRRLVFTWFWESTPERESLVTITLKPADGGTELHVTHEQLHEDAREAHHHGWTLGLDRLAQYLARAPESDR